MARFRTHQAGGDGWSDWTYPVMDGYRFACCDCGLVHDMAFRVERVTQHHADGSWESVPADSAALVVAFRARRNNRSTGQLRRTDRRRTKNRT